MLHNLVSPYLWAHWWIYWPMVPFQWYNTFAHHHLHVPIFLLLFRTSFSTMLSLWTAAYWWALFHALNFSHEQNTNRLHEIPHPSLVRGVYWIPKKLVKNNHYKIRSIPKNWSIDKKVKWMSRALWMYLFCISGTVNTLLWLYWTSSENNSAKLLKETSPLPRLNGLSNILVRARVSDMVSVFQFFFLNFNFCRINENYLMERE